MQNNIFDLSNKTALVTGGSRGIGLAIAGQLAQSGCDIVIVARDENRMEKAKEQIKKSTGKKAWAFALDLENTKKISKFFEHITAEAGEIDILVNCAGITGRAKAEAADLETWEKVIKVNLTAAFAFSQGFYQHRKKLNKPGRIVNIGSLMCQGARPTTSAYASSKGGLLMLTKSLAVEWAKDGINVNAIGPGFIATDLTEPLQKDADFNKWVESSCPMGRWGKPEEIAGAAVFLASAASDFMTGQIIYVDGGWLAGL